MRVAGYCRVSTDAQDVAAATVREQAAWDAYEEAKREAEERLKIHKAARRDLDRAVARRDGAP